MKRLFAFVVLVLISVTVVRAQAGSTPLNPTVPVITFDCYWEQASPQDYTITIKSSGGGQYVSRNLTGPPRQDDLDPEFSEEFTLSAATHDRIFQLAKAANYFNGDFDYHKRGVAQTGRKTLTYADPVRHFKTVYNWSEDRSIQQLTDIFEGLHRTIQYGHRLQYLHRYEKLGLDDLLKTMESDAQMHYLNDVEVIAPVLQNIAQDPSVINIARQRARRLLKLAPKTMVSASH